MVLHFSEWWNGDISFLVVSVEIRLLHHACASGYKLEFVCTTENIFV